MKKDDFHEDLLAGIKLWQAFLYMAMTDLRARYKRSVLGPFWIVLSLGFGSVGLGLLWSFLWGQPIKELLPSVTIGFLIWMFIATSLTEGSTCFTMNAGVIQNVNLPLCFFPLLFYSRMLVNFFHSWLIIIIIIVIFPPEISWVQLMFFPGVLITIIDLYLMLFIAAFVSTRYRDLQQLIASIVPLLFFVSPVLFKLKQTPELEWILLLNPLTYLITIVRDPILGELPNWYMYFVSIVLGIVLYCVLRTLINRKRNSLAFWV